MNSSKICSSCKQTMPISEFIKDAGRRDGFYVYCRDCDSDRARKRRYGLSKEQFEFMLESQNGVCAICKQTFDGTPQVDHSHETGLVRGLLCLCCNTGLARFKDSQDNIKRAFEYLSYHRSKQLTTTCTA